MCLMLQVYLNAVALGAEVTLTTPAFTIPTTSIVATFASFVGLKVGSVWSFTWTPGVGFSAVTSPSIMYGSVLVTILLVGDT